MSKWSQAELADFAKNETIKIEPFYDDQQTHQTPVTIWFITVDQGIYIRAYSGDNSKWYQAAIKQGAGKITAGKKVYDVNFSAVKNTSEADLLINQLYSKKYAGQSPLAGMISPKAANATILITPKAV